MVGNSNCLFFSNLLSYAVKSLPNSRDPKGTGFGLSCWLVSLRSVHRALDCIDVLILSAFDTRRVDLQHRLDTVAVLYDAGLA
jgi:hypothetical protein